MEQHKEENIGLNFFPGENIGPNFFPEWSVIELNLFPVTWKTFLAHSTFELNFAGIL